MAAWLAAWADLRSQPPRPAHQACNLPYGRLPQQSRSHQFCSGLVCPSLLLLSFSPLSRTLPLDLRSPQHLPSRLVSSAPSTITLLLSDVLFPPLPLLIPTFAPLDTSTSTHLDPLHLEALLILYIGPKLIEKETTTDNNTRRYRAHNKQAVDHCQKSGIRSLGHREVL